MSQTDAIEHTHHAPANGAVSRRLLSAGEVATWLGVSAGWVRDHATRKQPRLRAVKLGRLLRFRQQDVEEFIQTWCQ